MDAAFKYKRQHPNASYQEVADACEVPKMTFYDRWNERHAAPGINTHHRLSDEQERVLIDQISSYAD